MLSDTKIKIRALIMDLSKSDFETFEYSNVSIFTLSEDNINSITTVLKNGTSLGSGEYFYDSTTNKITIIASLNNGDIIEVDYTFYKYSDTELTEYIRASLVWISTYSNQNETDYEIEDDTDIYPTPGTQTLDLIALISSILIKPNYVKYSIPNLTVNYPRKMTKEERIEKLISRFNLGIGVSQALDIN